MVNTILCRLKDKNRLKEQRTSYKHSAMDIYDKYFNWSYNDMENSKLYDYVIVGAGSAGSVIAARLSKAGEKTLLLEAGGAVPPFLNIPVLTPLLQQSVFDWQHVTVPQKHACKGLINNQSKWPMGKILGGSGRLNYMAYVRGHIADYTDWFPDLEESVDKETSSLNVHRDNWYTDLSDAILNGAAELGQNVGNINRDLNIGFMKVELTSKDGERWSTDRLLHRDIEKLIVIANAHVNKVLLKEKKAVGVEFEKLGTQLKAFATKGVILCAGAVGTPKLLMLSGIGPRDHLKGLKIKVVQNLPVGQNLVDHILTGLDLVVLNTTLPLNILNVLNPLSAFNYFFHGKGPWTSAGIEVVGTLHSTKSNRKLDPPDIQLMVMPVGISQDGGIALRKIMGISDEVFRDYFSPLTHETAVSILPVLLHPKSSGEIRLQSSDPAAPPIIDPKYLSVQEDVEVLIDGIQFVKKLIRTRAMQKLGATLYTKHYPSCKEFSFDTSEYWECYVRHVTLTSYHPAGTCRIGSVVDEFFRVYSTENLYVVDASVLPVLPSGNINAVVVMCAEKAARLLINKKFLKQRSQCHMTDFIQYLFYASQVKN
ncbi:glucose dehydrogenase [FAD, quinone]-like isoform X1 [Neodiprion virginianus]|uniref:glucose dehydrogenase [FAD, quinone]-like isoform X1 n=2 Tax=Neodiprion virginianus TaxID=2961670 RepID=UPI001EE71053|nr:glucose dehydrogenase [FAD, quinone]-like isoform X1 [Neodiprion virginianus]